MAGIDKHTLCCLHFDESATKDECGNTWSAVGTLSLEKGKFSKTCRFGAEGSSGIYTDAFDIFTKSEWTVDFWIKHLGNSVADVNNIIFANSDYNIGNHPSDFMIAIYGNSLSLSFFDSQGYSQFDGNTKLVALPLNEFCHIAIVKDHTDLSVFKNGKKEYSAKVKEQICINEGLHAMLGDWLFLSGYVRYLVACIDEFRISDIARWTEDFTPPMAPYTRNLHLYLDEYNAVWGCRK